MKSWMWTLVSGYFIYVMVLRFVHVAECVRCLLHLAFRKHLFHGMNVPLFTLLVHSPTGGYLVVWGYDD